MTDQRDRERHAARHARAVEALDAAARAYRDARELLEAAEHHAETVVDAAAWIDDLDAADAWRSLQRRLDRIANHDACRIEDDVRELSCEADELPEVEP